MFGRGARGRARAFHVAADALHGAPHSLVPVPLTAWQWIFVLGVANLAPAAGFVLAWRYDHVRLGGGIFALSMAAALVFGVTHHFVLPNPDSIQTVVGQWSLPFTASAVLVAVTDFLGVVAGSWAYGRG